MFVNISSEELGGVQYVNPVCQFRVFQQEGGSNNPVTKSHNQRLQTCLKVGGTFPHQCFRRIRSDMNGDAFNLKISLPRSGVVGDRRTMVLNFAYAENQIELCPDQMLQHCANIRRAAASSLQFFRLPKQIVNVCTKRFPGIKMKFGAFGSEMRAGPVSYTHLRA